MAHSREQNSFFVQCVMGLVILLSTCSLITGIIMWNIQGVNSTTILLLVFGVFVSIFMVCGITLIKCLKEPTEESEANDTDSDPPPTYRNTWRLEYLKSGVTLDMEGSGSQSSDVERRLAKKTRTDSRTIWTTPGEVGVHSAPPNASSFSVHSAPSNASSFGVHSAPSNASSFGVHSASPNTSSSAAVDEHEAIRQLPPLVPFRVRGNSRSVLPGRSQRSHTVPIEPGTLEGDPSSRRAASFTSRGQTNIGAERSINYDEGLPTYEEIQRW